MQVLRIVEGLAGAVVVLIVLRDVFQSVVTPRPVSGRWRLNRFVPLGLWRKREYEDSAGDAAECRNEEQ